MTQAKAALGALKHEKVKPGSTKVLHAHASRNSNQTVRVVCRYPPACHLASRAAVIRSLLLAVSGARSAVAVHHVLVSWQSSRACEAATSFSECDGSRWTRPTVSTHRFAAFLLTPCASQTQMGFGDTQVPGPLPPLVNASSQPSSETDLTYIAPPPGPVYPLYVCHDRALPRVVLMEDIMRFWCYLPSVRHMKVAVSACIDSLYATSAQLAAGIERSKECTLPLNSVTCTDCILPCHFCQLWTGTAAEVSLCRNGARVDLHGINYFGFEVGLMPPWLRVAPLF